MRYTVKLIGQFSAAVNKMDTENLQSSLKLNISNSETVFFMK